MIKRIARFYCLGDRPLVVAALFIICGHVFLEANSLKFISIAMNIEYNKNKLLRSLV